MRRTKLRSAEEEGGADAATPDRASAPLPLGPSLLVWALMAGLAWGIVALALHFLL